MVSQTLDLRVPHDLIHPERQWWTPHQLRNLTSAVAARLATPLFETLRFVPDQRWWTRLALTSGVELWLLSWMSGQGTMPHDHSGASGSFTVLLGELTEDYRGPDGSILSRSCRVGSGRRSVSVLAGYIKCGISGWSTPRACMPTLRLCGRPEPTRASRTCTSCDG